MAHGESTFKSASLTKALQSSKNANTSISTSRSASTSELPKKLACTKKDLCLPNYNVTGTPSILSLRHCSATKPAFTCWSSI
jgi:hypothetical protein